MSKCAFCERGAWRGKGGGGGGHGALGCVRLGLCEWRDGSIRCRYSCREVCFINACTVTPLN